ncbi:hypothetical protein IGI04_007231, partial [Brassica rapa subsp. trilocularis]
PTHYFIQKSLRRRTTAKSEPSERDIGELSQPPSTEIRSVMLPPSHALVRGRSFSRRSDATRPHAQEEDPCVNLTRHHLRRTFAGATVAGHRPFAARKPPLHRRRFSAAAGDFPLSHHRRWPPPATGLRRLVGRHAGNSMTRPIMSRDYVRGWGSRDVLTSDAALVGGGSETSGLATQIVWGVGTETFAFDADLEGGGRETDCTSDAAYASCLFMLEINFYSGSSIIQVSGLRVRLMSRSDCYRIVFFEFIMLSGFMAIYWIHDFGVDF